MCIPKAYCPKQGYRYQILCRKHDTEEWEHCDYAVDTVERDYLINKYQMVYQGEYKFLSIQPPQKFWK